MAHDLLLRLNVTKDENPTQCESIILQRLLDHLWSTSGMNQMNWNYSTGSLKWYISESGQIKREFIGVSPHVFADESTVPVPEKKKFVEWVIRKAAAEGVYIEDPGR